MHTKLLSNLEWGTTFVLAALAPLAFAGDPPAPRTTAAPGVYEGRFCAGEGDLDFLRLIDESFGFFHPNPIVPNLTMLYQPEWDTFVEAGGWRGWWIQNSYGFSYAATPLLPEPWFSTLQRSWDLFWDNRATASARAVGVRPTIRGIRWWLPTAVSATAPRRGSSCTNKAAAMYGGFVRRMKVYAEKGDPRQKGLAALFAEAQKAPLPPSQE